MIVLLLEKCLISLVCGQAYCSYIVLTVLGGPFLLLVTGKGSYLFLVTGSGPSVDISRATYVSSVFKVYNGFVQT